MRGTVVLATCDHARSITAVLGELASAGHELAADDVELDVLVVDAGSTDDTVDVARRRAKELGFAFRHIVVLYSLYCTPVKFFFFFFF